MASPYFNYPGAQRCLRRTARRIDQIAGWLPVMILSVSVGLLLWLFTFLLLWYAACWYPGAGPLSIFQALGVCMVRKSGTSSSYQPSA
jgi:hypothetical protein